jgi:hypothetical protein
MKKHSMLVQIGLLSILFAVIHKLALDFSFYWTTGWFDIVMHGFGGLIGSLLVIYVLQRLGFSGQTLPRKIILIFVCLYLGLSSWIYLGALGNIRRVH